ncbi:hypothetical protein TNCV_424291 [Trichonephila clavipes]|nr:hypothetical protein TNCV_424291 [Trichonephila clavipes]
MYATTQLQNVEYSDSLNSNNARAMKTARLNETFPQAELRRLEQVEREAAHKLLKHPNCPKLVNRTLNIWHIYGLLRHANSPKLGDLHGA